MNPLYHTDPWEAAMAARSCRDRHPVVRNLLLQTTGFSCTWDALYEALRPDAVMVQPDGEVVLSNPAEDDGVAGGHAGGQLRLAALLDTAYRGLDFPPLTEVLLRLERAEYATVSEVCHDYLSLYPRLLDLPISESETPTLSERLEKLWDWLVEHSGKLLAAAVMAIELVALCVSIYTAVTNPDPVVGTVTAIGTVEVEDGS